jgi:hypothetical protein
MLVVLPPAFTDEVNNEVINMTPSFKLAPQDSDLDIVVYSDTGIAIKVVN